ncbi:DUF6292 family protein [Streptomyces griseoloalbus]|uniref:Uncharacterized protein n=1 Tax=Streptomyces griseoloalbus TaxID=67303 RepID=A0A7W8FB35_9ACTN|nr:DUF6292 family protein [Streptomyces albaduncus]MBB5129843.1 hypothetical protein [Streptomyces albaduncus]GGW76791.1 hypothetical protein GCM10010340_64360 [Streptomyces albaduncus]
MTKPQGAPLPDKLPHDDYMSAVADHLAVYGITVTDGGASENDGLLDGWINIDPASASVDAWPHGVYLGWDQERGWLLIEQGGGRNVDPLDPTAVRTYSSPQQVACSTANALRGRLLTGPITNDGTWSWDSRPLEGAVKAWASDEYLDDLAAEAEGNDAA